MKKLMLLLVFVVAHLTLFPQETGTLTDPRDGKIYKTVKIGDQWIMAENLAYKPTNGFYWYWGDTLEWPQKNLLLEKYGFLYGVKTAIDVAIPGWHVPTKDEWKAIYKILGGNPKKVYSAMIEGGSSGFNALFSGYGAFSIKGNKMIFMIGETAGFWSSTRFGLGGYIINLTPPATRFNKGAARIGIAQAPGFSVRLIKNN